MADPATNHGFVYTEDDYVDILASPFFDVRLGLDASVGGYIERIRHTLVASLELQLGVFPRSGPADDDYPLHPSYRALQTLYRPQPSSDSPPVADPPVHPRLSSDYLTRYRFCIADTEHDWRPGTEQHKFIERCLSTVDRQKQPWLIFLAHRVLGYSSSEFYGMEGAFEEPMGRESLQELWQKYKVDIAFYGHVHNYERTCPVYQNNCMQNASNHYSGPFTATTHVVVGCGGARLADFATYPTKWSYFRDSDFGFVKLTAFNHSTLLLEYKKSRNGMVYDHFTITRDYRDILACSFDGCPRTTLAS